jgi:hypothetical protein
VIGPPVDVMLDRVKRWLADGRDVRIFTARVSHDGTRDRMDEAALALASIEQWCRTHVGRVLRVTNIKDYAMIELWDDRAVQVHPNTGMRVDRRD